MSPSCHGCIVRKRLLIIENVFQGPLLVETQSVMLVFV